MSTKDFKGVTVEFETGGHAFTVDQFAALEAMAVPAKVCVDDGVTKMGEWGPETDYDKLRKCRPRAVALATVTSNASAIGRRLYLPSRT